MTIWFPRTTQPLSKAPAPKQLPTPQGDGETVLVKAPRARGLNRTFLYMGASWLDNYTIEADNPAYHMFLS